MEITLTEQQEHELMKSVYGVVGKAVADFKRDNGLIAKTYMKKYEAVKYMNVSNNTFDGFILEGLPSHTVKGVVRYYKKELDEFMLNH
ncbi:hypothetical protein ABM34_12755 [Companilactobacillus ginsenosidimutans]|uniref:DNA-binding protein n=2 Tax=Lactobacillaceae TaxID=33958 RepID=A0A0H4QGI1_9LACO|nr:hypothetical protein ABM34_00120 [Companilactobacillus ginsenosidimutans]AKP68324.1 hypothetical protein ABM34_12755 [Companilactobacillus ginsenosidimutans]